MLEKESFKLDSKRGQFQGLTMKSKLERKEAKTEGG